jgi:hypothetical protein
VAKIELPESWAGVAEPLRALMAEVEREARAGPHDDARLHRRGYEMGPGERRDSCGGARADRRRPGSAGTQAIAPRARLVEALRRRAQSPPSVARAVSDLSV